MYRVITEDANGQVLSDYTSSADSPATPEQLATNALHLHGTVIARVWPADADLADEPILTKEPGA